jgi:tRNA A-37 threonylcarbamoyl transferase component Bud32
MSLIGKQIGNYQIKAKLGEGGMGAVYLGEHPLIGKRVAVKVLLEELASKEDIVTRFFNEAKAVNDIGHQNIVDIVDFGKTKNDNGIDIVYFIMEFLDGESLAARLRRTGLAFNETMHVMAQCCSALAASHVKGIVHRDLKPENIYLCTRGTDKNFAKILDFGIAKLTGDGGSSSNKTRTGLVIGTPTYMSPEQCEGKGHIDSRSDVYSLGVVMYELLTGRVPFPGEGFGEILVAHLTKEPEPPSKLNPDVTPELEAIVLHAIEKDRNRRFQSMDEFGAAVADASSHLSNYKALPGASTGATAMRPAVGAQGATLGPTTAGATRPTTLSGSAAELDAQPAKKSKAPIFIVAGVVAAAAVAGILLVGGGKKPTVATVQGAAGVPSTTAPTATPTATPTPTPTAKPAPEKLSWSITTEPDGAEIYRAGKLLGAAPFEIPVTKGEDAFEIEIKKAGFVTSKRKITSDRSHDVTVTLREEAAATPVVAKKSGSSSGEKKERKKGGSTPRPGDDMSLMQPKF